MAHRKASQSIKSLLLTGSLFKEGSTVYFLKPGQPMVSLLSSLPIPLALTVRRNPGTRQHLSQLFSPRLLPWTSSRKQRCFKTWHTPLRPKGPSQGHPISLAGGQDTVCSTCPNLGSLNCPVQSPLLMTQGTGACESLWKPSIPPRLPTIICTHIQIPFHSLAQVFVPLEPLFLFISSQLMPSSATGI